MSPHRVAEEARLRACGWTEAEIMLDRQERIAIQEEPRA